MTLSRRGWMFPATILLVGINLRPSIAVIGPLLDKVQQGTGLSDTEASLLTTLPVALMGACLLGARWLRVGLGESRGIGLGLALIIAGDVARGLWPGATVLLATAIFGGIGIAMVQALMPAVIRRHAGARMAGLMAFYSTAIMGGALISGMAGPWLTQVEGWPFALAIWAVPAALGLLVWRGAASAMPAQSMVVNPPLHLHRQPRAWLLLAFFGLGTGAYTLVLAWLPPFYTQLGWSATRAGALLGVVTLAEVLAGLGVSLWIDRCADRRPALLCAITVLLLGMLCLVLAPLALGWLAAVLAGLGIGALFPLSLIVAMDHADSGEEAGAIAAFVQGGGYGLAAMLPLLAGYLRQRLANLTPAWWLMALICLVLALIAIRLRRGARLHHGS